MRCQGDDGWLPYRMGMRRFVDGHELRWRWWAWRGRVFWFSERR